MTYEQKYYLDLYKLEANKAYELMHDYRFDYDTYKPIADASYIIAEQSKKLFTKLYPIYINYPIFLKGLKNIYDNSKKESDGDQIVLKTKLDALNHYKEIYDSWINKINAIEIETNKDELSQQINEIANLPENLIRSDELALIQKEIEIEAQKAAKDALDKAEAEKIITQQTSIIIDEITGIEVCLDRFGNQIDMSICRPSNISGGGESQQHIKTASEIVNENIESWLQGIDSEFNKQNKIQEPIKEATAPKESDTRIEADTPQESANTLQPPTITDEIEANVSPEDYINSFVFNVDLSKLTKDTLLNNNEIVNTNVIVNEQNPKEDNIIPSNIIDNTIVTDTNIVKPITKPDYIPTKVVPDSINNSKMVAAAALLAVVVGYTIIKNKD